MEERLNTNRTAIIAGIIGAIAVLVALAALLNLGPFTDEDLSAAEFLARGDEICTQAHDDFLNLQSSTPRTPQDAETLTQSLINVAEDERESIRDLDPPASLTDMVDTYLAVREKGIDIMRQGLDAARDEDPGGYEVAQAKLAGNQEERQKVAEDLGFKKCSQPLVGDDELARQAVEPDTQGPNAPATVNNPSTGTP